jgi:L-aspartate oxidase
MWQRVGLSRDRVGLEEAIRLLDGWYAAVSPEAARLEMTPAEAEVVSVVTVGRLIARAALRREETRGGHYRSDFPERDDVRFGIHLGDTLH